MIFHRLFPLDPSHPDAFATLTDFPLPAGKLLSRSQKIAYTLLNKTFSKGDTSLKTGDRIALVYPNNDPINFLCAFYGCLQAGIVPVPIEVPLTRRVSFFSISFLVSPFQQMEHTINRAGENKEKNHIHLLVLLCRHLFSHTLP